MRELPWVDVGALPMPAAIDALEATLASGFDPASDPPRMASGDFLLMPSTAGRYAGVKVVGVARGNAARGLPVIQGVFVLWDAETLTPIALMDGAALTALRTPALSAVALRRLGAVGAARVVVFGRGPQGERHIEAVKKVLPVASISVFGRDAADVDRAVAQADVICCCTSAREPLFDGSLVRDDAVVVVVAIGSHEPDARELDSALMSRGTVVVEARDAALREAGDVIQAGLSGDALIDLAQLVRGEAALSRGKPRVFKSVGMAWEDVVVAAAAHAHAT